MSKTEARHLPPHCPHCVWRGPGAEVVGELGVELGGTLVGALVGGTLVGGTLEGGGGAAAPEPIAVVMGPDSMYTPET